MDYYQFVSWYQHPAIKESMLFLSQKTNKRYKQCDPNHNTTI